MKKKFSFPKYSLVAFLAGGVLLVLFCALSLLQEANISLYLLGLGTYELLPFVIWPSIILLISGGAVLFYQNTAQKAVVVLLTLCVCLVAFYFWAATSLFHVPGTYYEFPSDDNAHRIVVCEKAFLFSGGGVIYEKTSPFTMHRVGSYSTDDGYCPFARNDFSFDWSEQHFTLHYGCGQGGRSKTVVAEYLK